MDYRKLLNPVVTEMKPSGIRKFFDIAAEMDNVISLGVGEPDFKTPWSVRQAGISSLQLGKTRYTANRGMSPLLKEISHYLDRRFSLEYDPDSEILVTVGGSEAIDIAIRTVLVPGEEVIIPEPSFVCYAPIVELAGGIPVRISLKAEDGFRLTPDELLQSITAKTKAIILPFPSNPTGAVMRKEHLDAIAEVIKKTEIFVISDEIYSELTYGKERHVSFASVAGMKERTILVNGFSKAYSMTGWRLGFACAPKEIIGQMNKVHQYAIMCAPTVSQMAAIEAMHNCDSDVENMRIEYDMRRRLIVDGFNRIGLTCSDPEGAFYVFPSIKSTGLSSDEFSERLIREQRVAVIPGTAFGDAGEGYVRVSYSYSTEHILEALRRIELFLESL